MARINPVKKEESRDEVREIFEAMEKRFGMVPHLFATIARYPKALKPILDLYQALAKESSVGPKLQELANLEVSRINGCHYCLTHHTHMAKMAGLKDEQLRAWETGKLEGVFSDQEKTIIEYARQVTKDAEGVSDELFKRLSSYFTETEIVNLTLIIGLMNVFNRLNGALRVELEK